MPDSIVKIGKALYIGWGFNYLIDSKKTKKYFYIIYYWSQTIGDKVYSQKGNSPD